MPDSASQIKTYPLTHGSLQDHVLAENMNSEEHVLKSHTV